MMFDGVTDNGSIEERMHKVFADIALINIDNAIKTIDDIHDNTMFKQMQLSITASTHNAVHAIVDFYERIDKLALSSEEDALFRAFMYVNNQIKHDKNLQFVTYNVSGSIFPFDFPFRFGPPGVMWPDFPDNGSLRARGRREHYEKMLIKKDVKATLTTAKQIIIKFKS